MSTETTTDTKTPLVESQTFYATTGTFQILCVKAELALQLQAELRTANTALREAQGKVGEMRAALELVKSKWTFNNAQQHTHTWHDWADCITVIENALK